MFLLVLMIIESFLEVLSIGTVYPLVGILTSPTFLNDSFIAQELMKVFYFNDMSKLILPLTLIFGFIVIAAAGTRILVLMISLRFSFDIGAELTSSAYQKTLYQSYQFHTERNISEVINILSNKSHAVIHSAITPVLKFISSSLILLTTLLALLWINPWLASMVIGVFGSAYLIIINLTRAKSRNLSNSIASESTRVLKVLHESLGGMRDILIDGTQSTYYKIFVNADIRLRRSQESSIIISQSPRLVLEVVGISILVGFSYILSKQPGGIVDSLPLIGVLAMAAQRLLPLLQQVYAAWSAVEVGRQSLLDTNELLSHQLPVYFSDVKTDAIPFRSTLILVNLGFRYSADAPWVIRNLNLVIKKGERIGLVGTTGSGKSTLIDLIMGLLNPVEGALEVDGLRINPGSCRGWQNCIAHVPQSIFLADTSIVENIAFGVAKADIDYSRVEECARQAQIARTIEAMPNKYNTVVGERGIRLSGGQRQRLGIARALYKNSDVIILDEATSALDGDTEAAIIEAISCLSDSLTIIVIAHQRHSLKMCSRIFELRDNQIVAVD